MWHFSQNETNYGPFSDEQMAQYIQQGNVTAQTMVWCEGMTDWMQADQTQLASYFTRALPTAGPVVTVVEDPVAKERKRKRKMNYWALIGMGWMFGVIILCMGLQKSGERKESSGTPTSMTLAELAKNGPGNSSYIELTHLHFGEQL
jgi:GYF domain 2